MELNRGGAGLESLPGFRTTLFLVEPSQPALLREHCETAYVFQFFVDSCVKVFVATGRELSILLFRQLVEIIRWWQVEQAQLCAGSQIAHCLSG